MLPFRTWDRTNRETVVKNCGGTDKEIVVGKRKWRSVNIGPNDRTAVDIKEYMFQD